MRTHLALSFVLMLIMLPAFAQAPATQPAGGSYVLTPLGVRELAETNFIYSSVQTNLLELGQAIEQPMADLNTALASKGIVPTGGTIFVYRGASPDPAAKFELEIGMPVAVGIAPPEGFKSRPLEKQRAYIALYTGPLSGMTPAYGELYGQIFSAGHQPTDTMHERYIYWEGPDSPNNVVMIEVPLQEP